MRAIGVIMMFMFLILLLFMVFVALSEQDICQLVGDKEGHAPIEGHSERIRDGK